MLRGLKIRIYPNSYQKPQLAQCFGCARFVWNEALSFKKELYSDCNVKISRIDLINRIKFLKNEYEFLKQVPSQMLQQVMYDMEHAYKLYFKRINKLPTFKSKKNPRNSFRLPQGCKLESNKISLPKIGWVKAKVHRQIKGTVKSITISKDSQNHYYASILIDDGKVEPEPITNADNLLGIDLGLTDLLISSEGRRVKNPRFLKKNSKKIIQAQRKLSRTQKDSKRRNKARIKVARAHKYVANTRKDFQHKLSRQLANENQVIGVETLRVKNMLKNRKLSKAISDISWSSFLLKLNYKLKESGGRLIKIDQWFPSSKMCNKCNHKVEKLPLNIRKWVCPNCSAEHDRDINAAINIRNEALKIFKTADGSTAAARGGLRKTVALTAVAVESRSPVL